MKIKYAVLPAAFALLFSASSFADDTGTVYFYGSVKAPTCKVNNGNKDSYVNVGNHETSAFPSINSQVKGDEKVVLKLTECTGNKANLALTANNRDGDDRIKLKATPGSAKGLVIMLADETTNTVRLVDGDVTSEPIVNGEAIFEYQPYLVSTANVVEAGTIDASVDYTISYN
ncbi:hypothetical protein CKG00_06130 [Morganella morganii]|uniref:Fimbrial-type adhesion domain-containing protein n=1 Tax=Morganella morganii TaxID=582 RepID=A0A433ZV99_MORMO|nr:fimbrial protein [Morganella morganii]RUT66027.1 hypothetical protein CKG00_06130 [Morganella morganii]